ncbi:unnamed protein product [Fraxinus pennsylvanica]|uniref:50S ribosomal protein L35 n=1 Tax=Fraxinus pennsylvanica TaxID=56036 RepID=A0AAD2A7T1_9LAMI|nr:unnamed protein product [Fraxinus pennsylvanica]
MATTAIATPMFSFGLRIFTPLRSIRSTTVHFSPLTKKQESSINLSSSRCVSGFAPLVVNRTFNFASPIGRNSQPVTVVCAKGYKMKTHKASAKRFRVTGSGKIMRRRAGKQHLLGKKNTKRKLRLSKVVQVDRSDYNNVIGALPYLKEKLSIARLNGEVDIATCLLGTIVVALSTQLQSPRIPLPYGIDGGTEIYRSVLCEVVYLKASPLRANRGCRSASPSFIEKVKLIVCGIIAH